ncbi:hypothetical protein DFJ58DRAFT_837719 [Suillus subalutaceus]|uniref:uncharacterized protein n=1 Tax=Suillus subalutaceus TaxID=48586 RepID=UPI001B8624FC|nr:uncharacterized protein DFJ58DRAFT_837719 [Suillus subalutaceus]KAG1869425.1 hypothetical protein DFJ58DRAFT_837719 [Suillus subalutaceus]
MTTSKDDSSIINTAPPSYDTISASPILTPDINACTAALLAATFSKILQSSNIEGHTALYWAIVNNRPEVVFAFHNIFPPRASSSYDYFCDARLACMTTGDHVLFKKLNLAYGPAPGCPPDDIQVNACDEPENRFDVVLRIHMFQKRLRAAQFMYYEFVAGGRIWWLRFSFVEHTSMVWCVKIGLAEHSYPARPNAVLLIEAHKRKAGCETSLKALKIPLKLTDTVKKLVPYGQFCFGYTSPKCSDHWPKHNNNNCISNELGDWVMNDNTKYVDHEGTRFWNNTNLKPWGICRSPYAACVPRWTAKIWPSSSRLLPFISRTNVKTGPRELICMRGAGKTTLTFAVMNWPPDLSSWIVIGSYLEGPASERSTGGRHVRDWAQSSSRKGLDGHDTLKSCIASYAGSDVCKEEPDQRSCACEGKARK